MRRFLTLTLFLLAMCAVQAAPTAVKNRAFYEGITYQWPINAENQQTSNLATVATDPDQIIAMIREVYSNRAIPGTYSRGYSALDIPEGTWLDGAAAGKFPVAYPGIGTIANVNGNIDYLDYGWALPGNVTHVFDNAEETVSFVAGVDKGDNSSHTNQTKGAFHINFINNMNPTSWYLLSYGYDQRFSTDPGYKMTSLKFTFTAAGYGSTNIDYVRYRNDEGNMVKIDRNTTPSITEFMPAGGLSFEWTIPTDSLVLRCVANQNLRATLIEATYEAALDDYHFDPAAYLPNEEGTTLLLIEVKDGMTVDGLIAEALTTTDEDGKFEDYAVNDYASLRALVAATIKSARVLTDAKRFGTGLDAGTLFKIDVDKLNRFYLMGKGQLRWINNDYSANDVNATKPPRNHNQFNDQQPYYIGENFYDQSIEALFGHMFEQFSPASSSGGEARNDIYRDLVNMESFGVKHDCIDVISAEAKGHEFNMYGKESLSDDCQDVRDLMFFVPDYRMLAHDGNANTNARDPNKAQRFVNYNPAHAPTMALFVIKQNAITGEQVDGQAQYDLHLSWTSNLPDFLPGEDGFYELLRVTTDAAGNETYTPVAQLEPNTYEYTDRVAMLSGSREVTYAVRGQDADQFLTLQLSNKESYLVPGTGEDELLSLTLSADNSSRFDPQLQQNNYSNRLALGETSGIKADYLTTGADQLTVNRSYTDGSGDHTDVIATARVTALANGNGTLQVTMQNQNEFTYGYHANGTQANATFTVPFTYNANGVDFGQLAFYDNFSVSVADNQHPATYTYQVLFDYNDGQAKQAVSNEMNVHVHKTDLTLDPDGLRAMTLDEVTADTEHAQPAATTDDLVDFDIDVKYSSKAEILRYDAYRWNEGDERYIIEPSSTPDNELDVPPTGIAGNQGDYYTVAMNSGDFLTTGTATFEPGATTAKARFTDAYATQNVGAYVYAPVVEVFANGDNGGYNTYGAPARSLATGTLAVSVMPTSVETTGDYTLMSSTWTSGSDSYAYYTVYVQVDEAAIPEGYKVAKLRMWRKVDPALLGEENSDNNERLGNAEGEWLCTDEDNIALQQGQLLPVTFGARKLRTIEGETGAIEELTTDFVVRLYLTRDAATPSGAPRRAEGDAARNLFMVEGTATHTFIGESIVPTAVSDLSASKLPVATTYYNVAGNASSQPWNGVNIVITRYTDGTTTTTKVVK